ncbi:MAG: DUF6456 domain-containing protein [Rhizomicrobium sp.]
MSAAGEIEREARRVFCKLLVPGAHLRPGGDGLYRIASREDAARRSAPLGAAVVDAFVKAGWLRRAGGAKCYVLSDAGEGWLARATADDEPFAAQHQLRRTRLVTDPQGRTQRVVTDDAESPLSRLKQRGLLTGAQFDAGEKLRRDFTLARLMPRLGVDYSAPVVLGRRGQKGESDFNDVVLAAKQRFANAMRAAGPGLGDLLFDVCCHLRGLEEAERANAWPSRAGRVVLGIALDRLAEHYGLHTRGKARLRAWAMEESQSIP